MGQTGACVGLMAAGFPETLIVPYKARVLRELLAGIGAMLQTYMAGPLNNVPLVPGIQGWVPPFLRGV